MGTSVPNWKNELSSQGQGDVKTYKLSPEELAKIVGKPIPKSHVKPLNFRAKTKTNKEEIPVAKASKNDYLELRADALSRQESAKKLGITTNSLNSYWLPKWGINSAEAEEVAIARYKESIKVKAEDNQKPTVPVREVAAETLPATQPDDEPYKPVLNKAEDEAIKWLLEDWSKEALLQQHAATPNGWQRGTQAEAMNGMSAWKLAQVLIAGYTVELSKEEQLLEAYKAALPYQAPDDVKSAFREGMKKACEIAGIEVKWSRD